MKKNKKIWSWALAGALAVSNLSAVAIPITALAADNMTIAATSGIAPTSLSGNPDGVTFTLGDSTSTRAVTFGTYSITGLSIANKSIPDSSTDDLADTLDDAKVTFELTSTSNVVFNGKASGVTTVTYAEKDNGGSLLNGSSPWDGTQILELTTAGKALKSQSVTTLKVTAEGTKTASGTTTTYTATNEYAIVIEPAKDFSSNVTFKSGTEAISALDFPIGVTNKPITIDDVATPTATIDTLSDLGNGTAVGVTAVGTITPNIVYDWTVDDDTLLSIANGTTPTATFTTTAAADNLESSTVVNATCVVSAKLVDDNGTTPTPTNDDITYYFTASKTIPITIIPKTSIDFNLLDDEGNSWNNGITYYASDVETGKPTYKTLVLDSSNVDLTKLVDTVNPVITYTLTDTADFGNVDGTKPTAAATSGTGITTINNSVSTADLTQYLTLTNTGVGKLTGSSDVEDTLTVTINGSITSGSTTTYYTGTKTYKLVLNAGLLTVSGIPETMAIGDEIATSDVSVDCEGAAVDASKLEFTGDNTFIKVVDNKITAVKAGAGTVTVGYKKNGTTTTSEKVINITVVDALTATPDSISLKAGEEYDLSKVTIKKGDDTIKASNVTWSLSSDADKAVATIKNNVVTGVSEGEIVLLATVAGAQGYLNLTVTKGDSEIIAEAIAAAEEAADKAVATPSDDTISAAKAAVEAAKAAGATEADLKSANDKIAQAETAKAKNDAIAAANTAADAAAAAPSDSTIAAAKAAVEAAKAAGATEADLKAATDKIAQAEAAKAKADEEAKKKEEEQKKAADGSQAKTPAPVGTELKDASGKATGFKVTDANPAAPEVEFVGPADKDAKSVDIPEVQKDLSGNEYKVTSIAPEAFKDSKAKTVTIRKNIKKIDPNAFKNSKVKNAKIKGTKLTKKMAKAFKKLKKGGKITCSGSNKKKNKKYLSALKNVKNGNTKLK